MTKIALNCPSCGASNIAGADECENCQAPLTDAAALSPKRGMEKRILEGTVAALSPKPAPAVAPRDPLLKAVDALRSAKVGCALVVERGRLVGMVTEREVLLKGSGLADLSKAAVADVMRLKPVCLREDDPIAEVFHRMAMSGHLHVPIQLKDESYAVVSARDLLHYLCKNN